MVEFPPGYDPLALARSRTQIHNREAVIPSQCYTKTDGISNPCYTCHTSFNGRNEMDDDDLQREYAFSDFALENHWTNLFVDRSAVIASIGDAEVLEYIRQDNYTALKEHLEDRADYAGWVPDLEDLATARGIAFDPEGFARDGSWWRIGTWDHLLTTRTVHTGPTIRRRPPTVAGGGAPPAVMLASGAGNGYPPGAPGGYRPHREVPVWARAVSMWP